MTLTLASPVFLGSVLGAAVLLAWLGGRARQLAFLAVNLALLGGFFLRPVQALSTLFFCLAGYALARSLLDRRSWGLFATLAVYVAAFVYMRDYDFLELLLPEQLLTHGIFATLGLSFMFFKIVHVMVDVHGGTIIRLDLLTYLNYCLNFTTFMMGPIQRYQDYEAQWTGREMVLPPTFEAHVDALLRVLVGLVKAYVISAYLYFMTLADTDPLALAPEALVVRLIAFYFFLYINFSGYCDIVIGAAQLLGLRPPENFDKPFLARNIADFWLRFHRSLTLWLTSYVFSPLYKWALTREGLGRRPLLAANIALLTTMLVSGLWHGTTLSFLLFGAAHGLFFVVFRTWEAIVGRRLGRERFARLRANPVAHAAGVALTFSAVVLSLVFFQLSARDALGVFARLAGA